MPAAKRKARPSSKSAKPPAKAARKPAGKPASKGKGAKAATKPVLLSGGNPQIAKGYGDAPVQAYIAAIPGWKQGVTRRVDAVVTRAVPGVRKAVKWNSPLYGAEEGHYFLGVHMFTNYVKLAFFTGTSLRPMPPGESKQKTVRYLDVREGDALDEAQLAAWARQAAALPGEKM